MIAKISGQLSDLGGDRRGFLDDSEMYKKKQQFADILGSICVNTLNFKTVSTKIPLWIRKENLSNNERRLNILASTWPTKPN